jgi:hypothetical protein
MGCVRFGVATGLCGLEVGGRRSGAARRQYCIIYQHLFQAGVGYATYSNANAKSGCFAPGLDVIKDRDHCAEHVGLHHCDSTEGLASLLNVVVAVIAIFAAWLRRSKSHPELFADISISMDLHTSCRVR